MRRRTLLGATLATAWALPLHAAIVGLVVVGKDGWLFPVWDEVRHSDPRRILGVTQTINQAVGILKRAGIETVISLTPAKSRIYREFLPDEFRISPDAERRYAIALADLRAPGTLVPDLATLLGSMRRTQPDAGLFFKTDTHWTPAAAEPAAIEIAREIGEKWQLPPSTRPGTQLGDHLAMLQGKNDLSQLLPPAEQSRYPGEPYRVRRVIGAADQTALLEDDTADVVVVGNSFTQPKYGFSEVISQQLNRPVALAWKIHQVGPYRTMLDYFAGATARQQRPRLVIWDFEETDMEAPADRGDVWGQNAMAPELFLGDLSRLLGV